MRRLVVCTVCGKPFTGSESKGRQGVKYPYYHHQKQDCAKATFIPKETFEQNFFEYLGSISPLLKYEKTFKEIVTDIWKKNYQEFDKETQQIRKDLDFLEQQRQEVFELHRAHKYTDDEFTEQRTLINSRIQEKTHLLEELIQNDYSICK